MTFPFWTTVWAVRVRAVTANSFTVQPSKAAAHSKSERSSGVILSRSWSDLRILNLATSETEWVVDSLVASSVSLVQFGKGFPPARVAGQGTTVEASRVCAAGTDTFPAPRQTYEDTSVLFDSDFGLRVQLRSLDWKA